MWFAEADLGRCGHGPWQLRQHLGRWWAPFRLHGTLAGIGNPEIFSTELTTETRGKSLRTYEV
jgi:hypothetical protein